MQYYAYKTCKVQELWFNTTKLQIQNLEKAAEPMLELTCKPKSKFTSLFNLFYLNVVSNSSWDIIQKMW